MIAACALELACVVSCVSVALKKENNPTLLWFGAVMGLQALFINVIFIMAGRV